MFGLHLQNPIDNWLDHVAKLPKGTPVLSVDNIHLLRDAKIANPEVKTVFRKWWSNNQGYSGFSDNPEGAKQAARNYFDSFIDGTWEQQELWQYVDYVKEWNEYIATSQPEAERQDIIAWLTAVNAVWNEEYRGTSKVGGRDIPLVCCSVAIGNDIDPRYAKVVYEHNNVMSYHNYTRFNNGVRDPLDWRYHSGRWTYLDDMFKSTGIYLRWLMTEGGPYHGVHEGWRHEQVLNGDLNRYLQECLQYQIDKITEWNNGNGNRFLGGVLFTSGGSSEWSDYELDSYEWEKISEFISDYNLSEPTEPPIEPPPTEPPIDDGLPRVQYSRVVYVAHEDATEEEWLEICRLAYNDKRRSVGFSYDDAGIGKLDDKTAVLFNIPENDKDEFAGWYTEHYPATRLVFQEINSGSNPEPELEIIDIVNDLPVHPELSYGTREWGAIDTLVIHHTVGDAYQDIKNIASFHVNTQGWPAIGYHYVINGDGVIYITNRLSTRSYHVSGHNNHTVGIALQGNFTNTPPTDKQLESAKALVGILRGDLNVDLDLKRHKDLNTTACPGDTSDKWFDKIV